MIFTIVARTAGCLDPPGARYAEGSLAVIATPGAAC